MTTRETDTSEFDGAITSAESEALFDRLVEENVLAVEEDGGVRTTDAFDDTRGVYHDSYVGVSDAEFHEAVAATFGLAEAESAAELVEALGVERREFICYLALRSHLNGGATADGIASELSPDDLAAMARMVSEVVPDSPVPPEVADVTDDPEGFLAGRDRAVVSVWKRFCNPCDALKADLEAILDAIPNDVAVAGIDGEVATGFCETHAVESAPGVVLFRDGERVRNVTGGDPDEVVVALQAVYSN